MYRFLVRTVAQLAWLLGCTMIFDIDAIAFGAGEDDGSVYVTFDSRSVMVSVAQVVQSFSSHVPALFQTDFQCPC